MAKESVFKKKERVRPPRVHITYEVETGGAMVMKELPFVMGIMSDLSGNPKEALPKLKDRKFVEIDRDNFDDVLSSMKPRLAFRVDNKLQDDGSELSVELGSPGMANVLLADRPESGIRLAIATSTETAADIAAADNAARNAIVGIFGAIGVIVAGVAALAVISSMTVSLYERRHEFAALQALGARRRRLRGLLVRELLPVGLTGLVLGLGVGALGTRGIIGSFEASNAVDIGVVDAMGWIPFIAAGTLVALVLLAVVVVRSAGRRPVAVTLRGAG